MYLNAIIQASPPRTLYKEFEKIDKAMFSYVKITTKHRWSQSRPETGIIQNEFPECMIRVWYG